MECGHCLSGRGGGELGVGHAWVEGVEEETKHDDERLNGHGTAQTEQLESMGEEQQLRGKRDGLRHTAAHDVRACLSKTRPRLSLSCPLRDLDLEGHISFSRRLPAARCPLLLPDDYPTLRSSAVARAAPQKPSSAKAEIGARGETY